MSGLEMGKRYIVTIIAYRGNKRSRVVETVFKTGVYTELLSHFYLRQIHKLTLFS